jgi:hypothetical protein
MLIFHKGKSEIEDNMGMFICGEDKEEEGEERKDISLLCCSRKKQSNKNRKQKTIKESNNAMQNSVQEGS